MHTFCNCKDFINLQAQGRELFIEDSTYGWILSWIELTEEKGYTQVHRYGIPIKFCPMCGKLLKEPITKG